MTIPNFCNVVVKNVYNFQLYYLYQFGLESMWASMMKKKALLNFFASGNAGPKHRYTHVCTKFVI